MVILSAAPDGPNELVLSSNSPVIISEVGLVYVSDIGSIVLIKIEPVIGILPISAGLLSSSPV
jgi:hypothetical protein